MENPTILFVIRMVYKKYIHLTTLSLLYVDLRENYLCFANTTRSARSLWKQIDADPKYEPEIKCEWHGYPNKDQKKKCRNQGDENPNPFGYTHSASLVCH